MTTLVIGARGSVGRHVLEQLARAGEQVRASVRDLATAGELPGGVPVVAADVTRPETLPAALDGVRSVFVYSLAGGVQQFADAAKTAGVEHVVLLSSGSVLLPWATDNLIAREHREVEEALAGSGLRCTPIRPMMFASNALGWSRSIKAEGVVRLAFPDAVMAPVHERDIAAVAVAALTGHGGDAVTEMLTGGAALTQRRQVELVGAAIGRSLRLEELTAEQSRAQLARYMSEDYAAAVVEFIADADNGGSPLTDTAQRVLGRPPVSFETWAREHAADYR